MPFQVSPGVNVSEIDLTTIVPAVSTTEGAIAGVFSWGPVEERILISSEQELVNTFGKPTANNFETFYTAANFLAYGNQLYVARAAGATNYNAVANSTASSANSTNFVNTVQIKNLNDYIAGESTYTANAQQAYWAKYPGSIGNSLKISVCPSADAYSKAISITPIANNTFTANGVALTASVGSTTIRIDAVGADKQTFLTGINAAITSGDYILIGNTTIGTQYVQVMNVDTTNVSSGNLVINLADRQSLKSDWTIANWANTTTSSIEVASVTRLWEYFNSVDAAPGTSNYVATRNANPSVGDELHIVVADEDGRISGVPGQILEVWKSVSRATDAKGEQGGSIYFKDVLKNNSQWVWAGKTGYGSDTAVNLTTNQAVGSVATFSFAGGGADDAEETVALSKVLTAYDLYKSAEDVDVSLILAGKARGGSGEQLANYLIDNIAEYRKDCVVFVSPPTSSTVNVPGRELTNVNNFRNLLRSTSYAVLDSSAKYQYDKYNDTYRWVPMNGDIAGLCVRTDSTRDPWFSPAGFNRGNIKNIIRLAYNPDKADRDQLYKNGVNPVVNFPGQGTVLYGDKTLLARPSAFDRINVRRLFIVLEKAIAIAAKSTLFEFNDEFTRATFRNLVEPYLRDVQGRRGIYDFRVVCDNTNNTPEVIDRNEFRGDIYIKPARSINFIQLNFVAVRTGVEFEEIVGRF
jgi:hypothetical protein